MIKVSWKNGMIRAGAGRGSKKIGLPKLWEQTKIGTPMELCGSGKEIDI
jgi:hypothetical protein